MIVQEGQNKEVELVSKADFISNENDAERVDGLEGIAWAGYEFEEELEGRCLDSGLDVPLREETQEAWGLLRGDAWRLV